MLCLSFNNLDCPIRFFLFLFKFLSWWCILIRPKVFNLVLWKWFRETFGIFAIILLRGSDCLLAFSSQEYNSSGWTFWLRHLQWRKVKQLLDRSRSLFYSVPQESQRQTGSAKQVLPIDSLPFHLYQCNASKISHIEYLC